MKTAETTTYSTTPYGKLMYYTGDIAWGDDPTEGSWDEGVFTTPDGRQWVADEDDHSELLRRDIVVYMDPKP